MGLAKISKQEAYFNYRHPKLYFSWLEVDEVPLPPDTSYTMQGVPYQLSFSFVGLSFKSLGDIRYFYQLKGVDEQVMQTSDRQVRYTNLSSGEYTFTVLAEDNNQQRSEICTVDITIHSDFWQQFMPWIIAMLIFALAAWLFYRWRLHRHRQQAEQENAINRQFAELELQALQAQMNPHFVFNSLSAIQYFIAANERQQADSYLSKFAMLMRQFLESSKTRYLNLHQELHLIRLYIELEQMRFPNRFEAEVTVAPDINPYITLIPTMLLQPFVENAINHGLFHKMADGKLSLNIAKDENQTLICTLEDNGVGRAAAKGIQQKAGKAYRSRAMQITNERLHALRVIEGYDVNIKVTDLENQDGTAAGTRVRITVPEIE
jgi:two-component sensor histidine kinase